MERQDVHIQTHTKKHRKVNTKCGVCEGGCTYRRKTSEPSLRAQRKTNDPLALVLTSECTFVSVCRADVEAD